MLYMTELYILLNRYSDGNGHEEINIEGGRRCTHKLSLSKHEKSIKIFLRILFLFFASL